MESSLHNIGAYNFNYRNQAEVLLEITGIKYSETGDIPDMA